MSLPQDSHFEACYKCNMSVSVADIVKCDACEAPYHEACTDKGDKAEGWTCKDCREVDPKPKSVHTAQSVRSDKTGSSSSASKRHLRLSLLEEKQRLLDDQFKEKERQMEEKHRLQNELMESKLNALKDSFDDFEVLDECPSKTNSKVKDWLEENHKNKVPEDQHYPRDAQTKSAMHQSNKDFPMTSKEGNDAEITDANEPPKLSSTRMFQKTQQVSQTLVTNKSKLREDVCMQLDNSIIATRQVVDKTLPEFSGDPLGWPRFVNLYETTTIMCKLSNAENLLRLNRCLKGDALKAVEKLLYIPDTVPTAIEILRKTFGRPEFIINSMLEDIRSEPRPKYESFDTIIAFSLQVTNLCATMKTCSMVNHLCNPLLLQELVDKLPSQLKYDWALSKTSAAAADLESFSSWLESTAFSLTSILTRPPQLSRSSKTAKNYLHLHSSSEKSPCIICLKECSEVPKCPVFCDASYSNKWRFVKDHILCRICLKRHSGRCNSGRKCEIVDCVYKHHTLLHKPSQQNEDPVTPENEPVNVHNETSSRTLFKVVPVNIYGTNNKSVSTFAFLDEGSSVTLLDNSIAEELQLEGTAGPLCLKWTKDHTVTDFNSKKVSVIIEGADNTTKRFRLQNVRTVTDLNLPIQTVDMESLRFRYPHLKQIPGRSYSNAEPRILIGLDNARICSTHKIKVGRTGEPIAAKTSLGWSIYGSTAVSEIQKYNFHLCECNELSTIVKNFVALDNLEVKDGRNISIQDQKIIKSMEDSIRYNDGKYSCGLLWRYQNIDLPESYPVAKHRSECLRKRLLKDSDLHKILDDKIQSYEEKGYIRKLTPSEIEEHEKDHWYLPVFPVTNPNKPGKTRLVWDAAAKSKNVSLNDVLHKGPDLLKCLPAILLRFREKRFGLAGDIMEMFHQIGILESEQKYHWFLWQKQNETLPSKYAMTVLSFGAACSPCISQFVKNYHSSKYENVYPNAVAAILKNIYVDDWLDSFNTEEEAMTVSSEVFSILSAGGFTMRNWISNSNLVKTTMGCISESPKMISEGDECAEKVLGMWWDTKTDSFLFTLKLNKGNRDVLEERRLPTKREVLRILMSIFDPLGLVAHITVYSKIFLQKIWLLKLQWDDEIPQQLSTIWSNWLTMLKGIQSISIPRWYNQGLEQDVEYELHTFVDGSEQAFAAVSYIRCRRGDEIKCQLASAKTRTAPLKPLSIPRLELQSAVLGSRLAKFVTENSNLDFQKRVFWTDSKTVMCWLQSEPRKFKQFVSCRVGEILESCQIEEWKWIPTKLNPADIATRMNVTTEKINNIWYNGPSFLYTGVGEHGEKSAHMEAATDAELELRPQNVFHHKELETLFKVMEFSSFSRLRRKYFFIIRCTLRWKEKALKLPIVSTNARRINELADNLLFREAQQQIYGNEIASLSTSQQIGKSSSLFKLSPYLDEDQVIRTSGRIDYAPNILQNIKRPVILPPKHPVSRLIIDHYHNLYNHQNHETVINEIRQKYSISRLRTELKKVVKLCQYCKNANATPTMPEMAPLPPARLSSFTRPFTFSGIDYFGPITVIIGRKNEKRWCLLATCLTVRAIHIEVVSSLTTSSCVLALRNFFNRRGKPQEIYCDNGTNFRGASRELKEAIRAIDTEQITNEFADYEIKWCFNPPASPHMGGSWERLVRSVKSNLQPITSSKSFHEEVLRSFLIEIENIINSRPLTYMPIESENAEALTPNHFLLGTSNGNKPIGEFSDNALLLKKHWSTSQQLTNIFWKRWIKEYLPTLVRRTKWFQPCKPVEIGDVVIVFEDNIPRSCYPKGRIIDVAAGRDGKVRQVTVKTIKGIYVRPVSKIAVLDVFKCGVATADTQHGGGEMLLRDPVNCTTNTLDE